MSCAPKQNSQCRQIQAQSPFKKSNLVAQEWVDIVLVGADRPTKYNQQVGLRHFGGPDVVDASVDVRDFIAQLCKDWRKRAQIFKGHVTHGDSARCAFA